MGGVEADLERLSKAWTLTDEEEDGVALPGGLWETNLDSLQLCLVGRLLSSKPIRFESLCASLQSMLLPVKGMDIKQLDEGRFLLRFWHILNRTRVLDGCSWCFDRNLLIFNTIGELANPMQVDLEWCGFFVHLHELPLSMMNVGVATLIGNRLGMFRDMETDDTGAT
ncbi:UNVERIFIED_CONTAM: hypothetical protein Slati_1893800 [Sesamum latifolium]|uniref:DUF4283 domain-containing protein n=1 Tax=Sesamum latifolium TaxID=2727402 RepID=A0AAW2X2Z9_9LAMI